jgi:hypothetical protein
MKHLRKVCGGLVLVLALSLPVIAGEMSTPGIADDISTPGVAGETQFPGVAGDMQFPITGEIGFPGLSFILAFFF